MPAQRAREFLRELDDRSREIAVPGTVEQRWLEYCRAQKYLYASRLRGHGHLLRVLAAVFLDQAPVTGAGLLLDAGSISVLEFEKDVPAIRTWNWRPDAPAYPMEG